MSPRAKRREAGRNSATEEGKDKKEAVANNTGAKADTSVEGNITGGGVEGVEAKDGGEAKKFVSSWVAAAEMRRQMEEMKVAEEKEMQEMHALEQRMLERKKKEGELMKQLKEKEAQAASVEAEKESLRERLQKLKAAEEERTCEATLLKKAATERQSEEEEEAKQLAELKRRADERKLVGNREARRLEDLQLAFEEAKEEEAQLLKEQRLLSQRDGEEVEVKLQVQAGESKKEAEATEQNGDEGDESSYSSAAGE